MCDATELDYGFTIEGLRSSQCVKCGLLFLDPMPGDVAPGLPLHDVDEVRRAHAHTRLEWLVRYLRASPRRLLLVGADAVMSQEAARLGFAVFEARLDDLASSRAAVADAGSCQAAVLCCALETALDPRRVLANISETLEPAGVLMVIAPTIDSRTARLFGTSWWEFNRRNRFYFSADTLQCLLARMRFQDPIILRENSIVSVEYLRQKLASLKGWRFAAFRLVLSLSPPFLRRRVFAFLHTRTVFLVRLGAIASKPRLSIVMPVYNEAATFVPLMDAVLAKSIEGVDIEIVIVESNSTDGTRELVLRHRDHPRVRLIMEDGPSGKGHAVRKGLAQVTGDIVVIQDADLEYDIDDYDALLAPILRYESNFVIGTRHGKQRSLWKLRTFDDAAGLAAFFNFGHLLFLGLFNAIYRQRLTDPFSMFKVFRRHCLYGLTFECNRFDFDFELAIKLLRKGYRALEIPVNYRARSFSAGKKVSLLRDPLSWLGALIKFRTSPLYEGWTRQ